MIRSVLVALFLCALSISVAYGQSVSEFQTRLKTDNIKDIEIVYDKFKDQTVISTKRVNLISGRESFSLGLYQGLGGDTTGIPEALFLSVGVIFKGDRLEARPEKFALMLESTGQSWAFLKGDQNLYFLLDDRDRFTLEPFDRDDDVRRSGVFERKAYLVTREQVNRLMSAGKIELKIGAIPRTLKGDFQKRLSAFDSLFR